MDSQQDYSLAKKLSHPLFEIASITLMSFAWGIFTLSATNYSHLGWYNWLMFSRVSMAVVGALIVLYLIWTRKFYKNYSVVYLTISLGVQASHGYLEGSTQVEFYSFTGIIFILASLSFNGSFSKWIRAILPIQLMIFFIPLITKDVSYFRTPAVFVDSFSLVVSGLIIGLAAAYLTTSRYNFMRNYFIEKEKKYCLARQVAHDIRSPLEVLKNLEDDFTELSFTSRNKIRMSIDRIEEIANNLLLNTKDIKAEAEVVPTSLFELILEVTREKRIEYRSRPGILLKEEMDSESFRAYSRVSKGQLKNIISNIINNSFDSMTGYNGQIIIILSTEEAYNVIQIKDSGAGIPQQIQNKIFNEGFTTKVTGNGLGLSNAQKKIKEWGGNISFESGVDQGTIFTINLPRENVPDHTLSSIDVGKYSEIVIIDDDQLIHEIWESRFLNSSCSLLHFKTIESYRLSNVKLSDRTLLLIDFEFIGENESGVDVILKEKHHENSILVSARANDPYVYELCKKNEIKIISKSILSQLEIKNLIYSSNLTGRDSRSVVLIDDDRLIHLDWDAYCKEIGSQFRGFKSIDEFILRYSEISNDSFIYIDSSLRDGLKGEFESEKIFNLGFKNLFITTGYESDSISKPSWIKSIYSKNPRKIF